jgi:predicted regulator of Ras-like GTPase activity (Roadblock/LC7/MglB family)
MVENLSEDVKHELTELLRKLESRTELEACAVVSKEGMRIACAVGAELDADVYSAASAALVNLGETTLKQLRHGSLKEIIVRGDDGYTILTSAGKAHMIVGSCKNMSRMGYYLALLHRFSNKVAGVMGLAVEAPIPAPRPVPAPAGGPTAASLLEGAGKPTIPSRPSPTPQPTHIKTPPLSQIPTEPPQDAISEALNVLSPEEEPAPISIEEPEPIAIEEPELITIDEPEPIAVEEPVPIATGTSEDNVDKGALFEALQALGSDKAPATTAPSSKVETEALMDALKPQPTTAPISVGQTPPPKPTTKPASVPFTAQSPSPKAEGAEDDLFKISDKEAVLEALKVLGWEEPEEK